MKYGKECGLVKFTFNTKDIIIIRKATKSDLPIIEKLMIELIEYLDNKESFNKNIIDENFNSLLSDKNSYFLVAEFDGAVIGFITFGIRKTLMHSGPSGIIDEIIVTKIYQDKGLGQILINEATRRCKQLGCREIEVSTEFKNNNAREFYKKCGFEERGVILEKDLS